MNDGEKRDLSIAYGSSCHAKKWANKTITWDDLCKRLKMTVRTPDTVEEYVKLSKAERQRAKDKEGGFFGGALRGNRRKTETVESRSMLTMDLDQAVTGFIERFSNECQNAACLYTTHGHTPEAPRCRVIVPLTRDVTPDEYVALARYFAAEWGIDQFDECSYKTNQLMYWPTTPANGEFICNVIEGEWLDPDIILAAHPDWRDYSLLPTSSRESTIKAPNGKRQEDPLAKTGTVGAFCRTYTVEAAIDTFLSDVYEPSAVEGRYDYIPGEGSAGVVLYEDKFAYSHHATDPVCGLLLNAFDLVRLHLFRDLDDSVNPDTPTSKLPSFKAMCEFALRQDAVKLLIANERLAQAEEDFTSVGDGSWLTKLKYQPRSSLLENSVYNLNLILKNDPSFENFGFNEMAGRIQVTGKLPWNRPRGNPFWRDADTAQLKSIIDIRYLPFSTRNFEISFTKTADDRHFHPVRDYLDSLPKWDGVERVSDVFIRYLQADNTEYVRSVTKKAFAAAVARIYVPGTKFDSMLVMDGPQGVGKSTLIKELVTPEYYSEALSLTDMNDKTGAEKLQGFWVVEIAELAGMKKADIEKVKAFLSTTDDKYRPSYGRVVESHLRQCIIVATVNGERGYLRDITGNRRFWIVKVNKTSQEITWSFSEEFRQQFWAEAKAIWQSGEKLYLEGKMLEEAEKLQRTAMEVDERVGMVEEYLNTKLPNNWDTMDLYARRSFLSGSDFGPPIATGTINRTEVSNAEIWCECFGKNLQELRATDSYAIASLMLQLPGWDRTGDIRRQPIYGRQRLYRFSGSP